MKIGEHLISNVLGALSVIALFFSTSPVRADPPHPLPPPPINLPVLKITSITPAQPTVGETVTVAYQLTNVGSGAEAISGFIHGGYNGQGLQASSGAPDGSVTAAPHSALTGTLTFKPALPSSSDLTVALDGPPICPSSGGGPKLPCRVKVLASTTALLTVVQPTVHVRISGQSYANVASKDSQDGVFSTSQYLYVTHSPGCGWWGNNATDKFFDKKALPAGAVLEGVDYLEFWPKSVDASYASGNVFGSGGYGASETNSPPPSVKWQNTCWGPFGGQNVIYAISFRVAMPAGTDLGELTSDPGAIPNAPTVPPGYSRTPGTSPATTPAATLNLINNGVSFTGTFGSSGATGTLTAVTNDQNEAIVVITDANLGAGCASSGNVTLAAGATTTPAQMQILYGSKTPKYPKTLGACLVRLNDGSKQFLMVNLAYTPQN